MGLVLLVPYTGELFESIRFSHYFDDDEEPAWFYLAFAGIFGGLAGAGSSLFWNGGIKTPEEAREQRRYEVGQELKTLLVVGGAGGLRVLLYALLARRARGSAGLEVFLVAPAPLFRVTTRQRTLLPGGSYAGHAGT